MRGPTFRNPDPLILSSLNPAFVLTPAALRRPHLFRYEGGREAGEGREGERGLHCDGKAGGGTGRGSFCEEEKQYGKKTEKRKSSRRRIRIRRGGMREEVGGGNEEELEM